jgi:hypothetical protein
MLGGVLAVLGLLAGHVNRNVLDGPTFARHVDEIRTDDAVAAAIGRSITTQVLAANPDLVAVRPLIEAVATRVAGSEVLAGPARLAARVTHEALTVGDADSVALRIADAGAVTTAVLVAVVPDRAPVTTDVSVTLATIGDQSFASTTIQVARVVGVLSWLFPLAALACFGTAIGLSRSRWRTAAAVGRSVLVAAAVAATLLVIGGFAVRLLDVGTLSGAVGQAAWQHLVRPIWWSVALLAAAGVAVVLATEPGGHRAVARQVTRVRAALLGRPQHPAGIAVRAAVAVVIGIAAVVEPLGLVELAIVLVGIALILFAISEISGLAAAAHPVPAAEASGEAPGTSGTDPAPPGAQPIRAMVAARPVALAVAALAMLAIGTGVALASRPGGEITLTGTGVVCNGHPELCDRPFDEVAYVASHNSMAVAGARGWFLGEQSDPIPIQLDQGVRALLIDVWPGQPAGSVVRTAGHSHQEALRVAEEELGPDIVAAALRIADSVAGTAVGPEARFLCHGLCETGSTPLLETLAQIRVWLATNPDEVVTLFIEDHVDAAQIATDVAAAGLLPFVHQPVAGQPWPTLGEMIRSGQRLVVMLEAGAGGDDDPWLVNGFEFTQETPYTFPTVDSFSCEPNRGAPDASLLLLNHWLAGFSSLVSDAELVNARDVLLPRAEQCREERSQIPNFVAVNFVSIGDVHEVVDTLNSVGWAGRG